MSTCSPSTNSSVLPTGWRGSTYLNSTIRTFDDLAFRVKTKLGFPQVQVEIADEQMASFINEALEIYTKYAGFTVEYIVWCTTQYQTGLGIKLDRIFNYDCYPQPGIHTTTTYEVTSTTTSATSAASTTSLLSAYNMGDGTGNITLTYDPDDVWAFNVCNMDRVVIEEPASYSETVICDTTGLVSVANGVATFYSTDYNSLQAEPCPQPLSAYWPCGVDVSSANWLHVSGLPPCTLLGYNPILSNNGKYATVSVCNTAINTQGPVPVSLQFLVSDRIPSSVVGTYAVAATTGGFKVNIATDGCVPTMGSWGSAQTTFYTVTSEDHYGYVSSCVPDLADDDLGAVRKVAEVTSIDRGGTFGGIGENYLYGMDYAIAQNLWGGTATAINMNNQGFDFVTYELLSQYIDLAKRLLARKTQFVFNKDTQYLKLIPEPRTATTFPGCANCKELCYVVSCYVEKPVAHMLKERWVQNYTLALTMIALGHIRGKFGPVTLFGGGSLNAGDVMTQGLELKEKMEQELLNSYGDAQPPLFLVG